MMTTPSSPIQLVVGLGNPGLDYERTRHNAGFWAVDALAEHFGGKWKYESKFQGALSSLITPNGKLYTLKPTTFMNRSGISVAALAQFYRIPSEAILVIHDELDLPPGTVRLKWSGGHAGHNGLKDIARTLGHLNVWRLRLGIDHPGDRNRVADYVLSLPRPEHREALNSAIDAFIQHWPSIHVGQFEKAMHTLHTQK